MGLSHSFLLGGVDSKPPVFRLLIGIGAFLRDLNVSSLAMIPTDASLDCFGLVDIKSHLGWHAISAACLSKVNGIPCTTGFSSLSSLCLVGAQV